MLISNPGQANDGKLVFRIGKNLEEGEVRAQACSYDRKNLNLKVESRQR